MREYANFPDIAHMHVQVVLGVPFPLTERLRTRLGYTPKNRCFEVHTFLQTFKCKNYSTN